ncbi:MAG: hypothetical protein M3Q58_03340 [Bacteroidota bacterium]|nr:hypothetical protein [Bacteroidota bacterium]
MKKTYLFLTAILLLGIAGCQKKPLLDSSEDIAMKSAPSASSISFNLSSNPVSAGDSLTFSAIVTKTTTSDLVTCGKVAFQKWDSLVGPSGDWVDIVSPIANTTGTVTYKINPVSVSHSGLYRARFIGSGAGCSYKNSVSSEELLEVITCSGISLIPELISYDANSHLFTIRYTVISCENYTGLKLQGGLIAVSSNVATNQPDATIKYTNNNNAIISWYIDSMNNETKSITITYNRTVSGTGPSVITGDWSVKGYDSNNNPITIGYNNEITYTP